MLTGCSKNGATGPLSEVPEPPAKAAAGDNPMVTAALDDIGQKVKSQQLDAAVGSIVSMAGMPKSDAQQAAFMYQMRQASEALNQKAQQGDPAAQQSVNMLGRMMTGR